MCSDVDLVIRSTVSVMFVLNVDELIFEVLACVFVCVCVCVCGVQQQAC